MDNIRIRKLYVKTVLWSSFLYKIWKKKEILIKCLPFPLALTIPTKFSSFQVLAIVVIYLLSCVWLLWPHRLWPAGLLCPWDSPGKNTVMGCHFLLHRIFPDPGVKLVSPELQVDSLLTEPPGEPAFKSYLQPILVSGFPWWLSSKESTTCNAGGASSTPGSGRSPGKGNGNPLQYSCLGNPMERGAWWAVVHGVTKSDRT